MIRGIQGRNLAAKEKPVTVRCNFCGDKVQYVRAPMVAGKLKHRRMCDHCAQVAEMEAEMTHGDTSHDRAADPYCIDCFEPFTAKYPHQHRCAQCAEKTAAQWASVPPQDKPPKLVLVRPVERLATFVLDNAMHAEYATLDFETAYQARVNTVRRGIPTAKRRGEAQAWEKVAA